MSTRAPRTVLITGGTGGIGTALVERFVALGDQVWFTDPGHPPAVEVPGSGLAPLGFTLDLTSYASVERMIDALPGTPDVLIHNAALGTATVKNLTPLKHEQDQLMFRSMPWGSSG